MSKVGKPSICGRRNVIVTAAPSGCRGTGVITDDTAFRLSRIYAEGWIMASELPSNESDELDPDRIAALNPYTTEPERSRWRDGFSKAIWSF